MAEYGTGIQPVLNFIEQTGTGNGDTLETFNAGELYGVNYYDPSGAARTGAILEAGVEDGQVVYVVNVADADESITFAAAGTSNVSVGTTQVIEQNEAMTFIWHAGTALWYPTRFTPAA